MEECDSELMSGVDNFVRSSSEIRIGTACSGTDVCVKGFHHMVEHLAGKLTADCLQISACVLHRESPSEAAADTEALCLRLFVRGHR
jgi:hypothetical protein